MGEGERHEVGRGQVAQTTVPLGLALTVGGSAVTQVSSRRPEQRGDRVPGVIAQLGRRRVITRHDQHIRCQLEQTGQRRIYRLDHFSLGGKIAVLTPADLSPTMAEAPASLRLAALAAHFALWLAADRPATLLAPILAEAELVAGQYPDDSAVSELLALIATAAELP